MSILVNVRSKNVSNKPLGVVAITIACMLGDAGTAMALDRLTPEDVQKIGRILVDAAGKPTDLPIRVDAVLERGSGVKHGELATLILPDRNLTLTALEAADKDVVPVGMFWLRGLAPSAEDKAIATDKLRTSKIDHGTESFKVTWYLIGARKQNGNVELVVYGAEKKPLLETKLVSTTSNDSDDKIPIFVTAEKKDDNSARIYLSILGKYKASIDVIRAD